MSELTVLDGWFERPTKIRHTFMRSLSAEQLADLLATSEAAFNNPYAIFRDDPVGFISMVLGEHLWSKQVEICEAIMAHNKVAVPATNGCGKSFLMSRLVAWFVVCNDPTTTRVVSFAPSARQVRDILWNELRALASKHSFLPGRILQTEWKINDLIVANGFSCGGDADETKFQGIHKPNILIIVDEAAGVAPHVGKALRAISTNESATLVAIGNPPTGDEHGFKWFEEICSTKSERWKVVRITAWDLPSMTDEPVPQEAADGLTSKAWVEEMMADFAPSEPWYKARLDAEFVDIGTSTAIPKEWLSQVIGYYDPLRAGSIRLGVDVSSTGGDEYVVACADGENVSILYRSSGADNQDQTILADNVFKLIAEKLEVLKGRVSRGLLDSQKLIVRIDTGGLGSAVKDIIVKLITDGGLEDFVLIEAIDFSARAFDSDRFKNVRAEMYWTLRELVRHHTVALATDSLVNRDEYIGQISAPRLAQSDTDRRYSLESKKDMKRRRIESPDLADAIVLATYDVGFDPAIINSVPGAVRNETAFGLGNFAPRQAPTTRPRTRYY